VLERVRVVPLGDAHEALAWLEHHHRAWTAEPASAPQLLVLDSAAALLAPLLSTQGSFRGTWGLTDTVGWAAALTSAVCDAGHALLETMGRWLRLVAVDHAVAVLVRLPLRGRTLT
jgi:hypothetical protein